MDPQDTPPTTSDPAPAPAPAPPLRRDAHRNREKLKAAAFEAFSERGLGAPLEDIARRAGVSIGTLYNRFPTRDALIDAVVPEVAAARLGEALARAQAATDPWERFATYVTAICDIQAADPALNEILLRRHAEAPQLAAVCDASLQHAEAFIDEAQAAGVLRGDFTSEDLFVIMWANAAVCRTTGDAVRDASRRNVAFVLDGLRTAAAHPLATGPGRLGDALAALHVSAGR